MEDHGAGLTFPSLWKGEASPLQTRFRHYNIQTFLISPTLRSQEIIKGRQEMMEMIKDMPEASYELSLKDLIIEQQLPMVQGVTGKGGRDIDEEESGSESTSSKDSTANNTSNMKRNKKGKRNDNRVPRTESMEKNNGGQFLLKLFFPVIFESKQNTKKSSKKATISSKVSPKPPQLMEVQKRRVQNDKKSPKKRLSAAATSENIRAIHSRQGRSNSSTNRRSTGGFLRGCWSFNTNKAKTSRQEKNQF